MSESFIGRNGKTYQHIMLFGRMTLCEVVKAKPLSRSQIRALKKLGQPGHYTVGWAHKLTAAAYRDLKNRHLIEEVWTWASTTRPDVGITEDGVAALKEVK